MRYTTATCLALEMPNAPGGFARVARVLALAGINIDSIYASAAPRAGVAFGILGVSDVPIAWAYTIIVFFGVVLAGLCLYLLHRGIGMRA